MLVVTEASVGRAPLDWMLGVDYKESVPRGRAQQPANERRKPTIC
jgi:hypothetical protein